jgi:hypothetical protein
MATYEIDAYGARAKVRDIGIVILLTFVTLGIYFFVWYYRINRELRDFGRAYQDPELSDEDPTVSVLAITLGALILVPAIVSFYRTVGRIRRAQRIAQTSELTNGWVIFGLYLAGIIIPFVGLAVPAYIQSGLNSIWNRYPRIPEGGALPPGQQPAYQPASQQPQYQQPAQQPQYQPTPQAEPPPPAPYQQPPAQQPPQPAPQQGEATEPGQPPPPPGQQPPTQP